MVLVGKNKPVVIVLKQDNDLRSQEKGTPLENVQIKPANEH